MPTAKEIASRWGGITQEQQAVIGEDYNYERDRLGDYELEEIWLRVKELVVSDEEASMWAP